MRRRHARRGAVRPSASGASSLSRPRAGHDLHARGRRVAVALLGLTLLVLTVAPGLRARAQGATSSLVAGVEAWFTPRDDALRHERAARLAAEAKAAQLGDASDLLSKAEALSSTFARSGRTVVTARVIAFTPVTSAGGARRVQLDAGSDAGIETDEAVVATGGLVGRVTAVTATSATVALITDPSSVVGARIEPGDALARVSGQPPAGVTNRSGRDVSLVVAQGGSMTPGRRVVTAGSPSGRPYPAGLVIGTITSVDADHGQLERSATVRPAVDLSSLDVVGVLTDGAGRGAGR